MPAGAAEPAAPDRAAIQELLDRRAAAITARDKDAFMATISPDAVDFRRRQARAFDWLATVPLGAYSLEAKWDRMGDLVRPSDAARYPRAERVSIPVTEERYRLRGFDRAEAVEDLFYTFVEHNGEWHIADDTDLEDIGFFSARHLWEYGPVYTAKQRGFLAMGHPCGRPGAAPRDCRRIDDDLFRLAREARRRVMASWPAPWDGRVVLLLPGTDAELTRLIQATFDLESFVAFAYSTVDLERGVEFTAPRVIFNQDSLAARSREQVLHILTHELLHVATREASGPFVPVFVEEGFAEHVGRAEDPDALAFLNSEVASGAFDRSLPSDYEFTTGDGDSIFRSYQESLSAVRFFIERYGVDRFVDFYKELGSRDIEPGLTRYHLDDALRKGAGISFRRFQRAWADSIAP